MTRIKVCGLTEVTQARDAAWLGVDAIGLVFFEKSPRHVSLKRARDIAMALPPFVATVGLFVNETADNIRRICAEVPLQILQFHGDETPQMCRQFGLPYLKAVRVNEQTNILALCEAYHDACGLLCDTWVEGVVGGTGQTFNWRCLPEELPLPLVLSGGLHAGNVAQAIKITRPWAVDVSSGVESAPGQKDRQKIAQFIAATKRDE
jgi:phosphoribosylanthranilate isomerase